MNKKISMIFMVPLIDGQWGSKDEKGFTTAHFAARYGDVAALKVLGVVNSEMLGHANIFGVTPAHLAAAQGHVNVLRFLNHMDPSSLTAVTHTGWNLVHFAALNGHNNVIDFLRDFPVDFHKEDIFFISPMMLAHQSHHYDTVSKLMSRSFSPGCQIL